MADFLDEKHKEIQARLKELAPLVEEYKLLQAADEALSSLGSSKGSATVSAPAATASASSAAPSTSSRRSRRSSGSSRRSSGGSSSGGARRGRPRGSGTRASQALDLVRSRPGITIPEMAEAMGIKQNYLYRVMPTLAGEGRVVKSGRGWHLRNGDESGSAE
jgi:hypothetical protein